LRRRHARRPRLASPRPARSAGRRAEGRRDATLDVLEEDDGSPACAPRHPPAGCCRVAGTAHASLSPSAAAAAPFHDLLRRRTGSNAPSSSRAPPRNGVYLHSRPQLGSSTRARLRDIDRALEGTDAALPFVAAIQDRLTHGRSVHPADPSGAGYPPRRPPVRPRRSSAGNLSVRRATTPDNPRRAGSPPSTPSAASAFSFPPTRRHPDQRRPRPLVGDPAAPLPPPRVARTPAPSSTPTRTSRPRGPLVTSSGHPRIVATAFSAAVARRAPTDVRPRRSWLAGVAAAPDFRSPALMGQTTARFSPLSMRLRPRQARTLMVGVRSTARPASSARPQPRLPTDHSSGPDKPTCSTPTPRPA